MDSMIIQTIFTVISSVFWVWLANYVRRELNEMRTEMRSRIKEADDAARLIHNSKLFRLEDHICGVDKMAFKNKSDIEYINAVLKHLKLDKKSIKDECEAKVAAFAGTSDAWIYNAIKNDPIGDDTIIWYLKEIRRQS